MSHNVSKICSLTTLVSLSALLSLSASGDTRYGDLVSSAETIRIGSLLNEPDRFVDKLVKIEGLVDDVCPMKGCWVDVLESQSRDVIRFKVQDDVVIFPVEAKGQQIIAEGFLRKYNMTKAQTIRRLHHLADEKGENFDEATVTGPTVFYQIEGIAAVVR
ncbi:MAG TPA: DUF4920 domain-containing protein [Pseudomonadales bacterium]|jgi:hypothetical protein|nr:hypothetical protein [Gammaproteobacteria bacterium]MDP6024941.1 DUF4920 domain-containing protein [Pseudomonadales bacterium]MDP7316331.1 DUF4920 domain-containing protein [Pseudomonadales bacterium]MDP7576300.1 DUF4920 domain-containing protein [Pseudomonadales bacterium]HJL61817.1 DUF4920 domain-containing protein [Pseudomonadales bacterium]|tara:strand:- start:37 stop:516 length:480 start_codon:yes stop_codon:yes gene_type:complete